MLPTDDNSHISEATKLLFPVVGIGASAGGLAAFEKFLSGIPEGLDPGIAFVLVQHLAPDHRSILAELLGRVTHLNVMEVEDGMAIQPNCVYVIPPGMTWLCLMERFSCWNRPSREDINYRSIFSFVRWLRTSISEPLA